MIETKVNVRLEKIVDEIKTNDKHLKIYGAILMAIKCTHTTVPVTCVFVDGEISDKTNSVIDSCGFSSYPVTYKIIDWGFQEEYIMIIDNPESYDKEKLNGFIIIPFKTLKELDDRLEFQYRAPGYSRILFVPEDKVTFHSEEVAIYRDFYDNK